MRPRLLMVIGDMGAACLRTVIREPSCHTPECEYRMVGSLEEKRYGVNWSSIKRSSIFAPVDDFSIQIVHPSPNHSTSPYPVYYSPFQARHAL